MNLFNIKNSIESMPKRGWDTIYWFVDFHATIAVPDYGDISKKRQFYPYAKEVLQYVSNRNDICLVLWTCSHADDIHDMCTWLEENHIHFKYANKNPECINTKRTSIDGKPYYNVMLDDRAGFEPDDWKLIKNELEEIYETTIT